MAIKRKNKPKILSTATIRIPGEGRSWQISGLLTQVDFRGRRRSAQGIKRKVDEISFTINPTRPIICREEK